MDNLNSKSCPRCKNTKLNESHFTYQFKYCDSCIDKRRAYRKANEEHVKETGQRSYQKNTENVLERCKQWKLVNYERLREYKKRN